MIIHFKNNIKRKKIYFDRAIVFSDDLKRIGKNGLGSTNCRMLGM